MKKSRRGRCFALWMIVAALMVSGCSKGPEAVIQPAKAPESKDRTYRSLDGRTVIAIVSSDEIEIRKAGENIVCKYTEKDKKLRIVVSALGTTTAKYYDITPDGLVDESGDVLYESATYDNRVKAEKAMVTGNDAFKRKDYSKAIIYYSETIHLTPKDARAYHRRANAYLQLGDLSKALDDCNATLNIYPEGAFTLAMRGTIFSRLAQYDKAHSDYQKAVAIADKHGGANSETAIIYNNYSWFLSVCPDARFRDGKKAVEYAEKIYRLVDSSKWFFVGTLAAAHAEAGNFDAAVKFASESLTLNIPEPEEAGAKERLLLYENKKAYHQSKM